MKEDGAESTEDETVLHIILTLLKKQCLCNICFVIENSSEPYILHATII